MVLPGDAPFITSSVLIELIHQHRKRRPAATVLTALLSDPGSYGKVIRNGYLGIEKIVESKDAKKEYYLTEVISLFNQRGLRVEALRVNDPTIALGVNTRKDLKRVIQIMKGKR